MRALVVVSPQVANSAQLTEIEEPPGSDGDVLVEALAIGLCGADRKIIAGNYGSAPSGSHQLVIGHESLGRVLEAPAPGKLRPGLVIECTSVILEAAQCVAPDGIVCLAGVSSGGHNIEFDVGRFNRSLVPENTVIFGTVNANRRHYEVAATSLARADQDWLRRLITRRVGLDHWEDSLQQRPHDIKVVIDFAD
jgi:threonine dehydrogenase-like Zn-dependent dehydrogenase